MAMSLGILTQHFQTNPYPSQRRPGLKGLMPHTAAKMPAASARFGAQQEHHAQSAQGHKDRQNLEGAASVSWESTSSWENLGVTIYIYI